MGKRSESKAVRASLPMASQNYSVEEAAAVIGVSRDFAFKLLASGALKSTKIGKRRIVPGSALARYLDELAKSAA